MTRTLHTTREDRLEHPLQSPWSQPEGDFGLSGNREDGRVVYPGAFDGEHVIATDLDAVPHPNVPMPVLLQGSRTFLCFYTSPFVHDTSTSTGVAIMEWHDCRAAMLGPPNDEARNGHRLWKKGMEAVTSGPGLSDSTEVVNSQWIAAMERANRVHPQHNPSLYAGDRHFVILFKDATFECVANGYTVGYTGDDIVTVLRQLADQVVE